MENALKDYADLLTVHEVAEILRVSNPVVYKLIQENQILAFKFDRQYKVPKIFIMSKYFLTSD